jgi:intracellular septation protein
MRSTASAYLAFMHPGLKLSLDLGPLIAFFVSYYAFGMLPATGVFMAATLAAAGTSYALVRSVSAAFSCWSWAV